MPKVVEGLSEAESLQEFSDASPCCFHGSFVLISDECFKFCEHHLDGIEVATVGRQEEEVRADIPDRISASSPLWLPRFSRMTYRRLSDLAPGIAEPMR